jgi:vacuolar-type H+-ATPase subunit E/Vma4
MERFRSSGGRGRNDDPSDDETVRQTEARPEEHDLDARRRVTQYLGTSPSPAGGTERLDRVGVHVSAVLRAAEEAAERIETEARREADTVLDQARREATAKTEDARQHAEATMEEAARMRSEAEEWAHQTREAAENYSSDRRGEAETEATQIIRRAEEEATAAAEQEERRRQALKMDISLAEERLRRLADGLYELAARLEELLPPRVDDAAEAEEPESLVEALAPNREGDEESAS